jgi:N-acetylneuraminic acid mutarotase
MAYAQQSLSAVPGVAERIWMYGGISSVSPLNYSSELWSYTPATGAWDSPQRQTNSPPALVGSAMCALGDHLYLFGGANFDAGTHDDFFSFNTVTESWSRVSVAGYSPSGRAHHGQACSSSNVYLFGGEDSSSTLLNDLSVFSGSGWSATAPSGSVPSARKRFTLTHANNGKLYLFGGAGSSSTKLSDAYALDTGSLVWVSLTTTGERPTPRDGHSAIVLDERLYVFGGNDQNGWSLNDVRFLDLGSLRWTAPRPAGVPPGPRSGHVASLVNQKVVVYGGVSANHALLNDTWTMSRQCTGRISLTTSRATFVSGDGGYRPSTECSWLIAPSEPHRQVRLYFSRFALEQGADYVTVYQGSEANSDMQLARLTGSSLPTPITAPTNDSLLVVMTTDAVNSDGAWRRPPPLPMRPPVALMACARQRLRQCCLCPRSCLPPARALSVTAPLTCVPSLPDAQMDSRQPTLQSARQATPVPMTATTCARHARRGTFRLLRAPSSARHALAISTSRAPARVCASTAQPPRGRQ